MSNQDQKPFADLREALGLADGRYQKTVRVDADSLRYLLRAYDQRTEYTRKASLREEHVS